ncbi:MAG: carbohydrate kinase family protein [Pseudonocardiaceae bacterium]
MSKLGVVGNISIDRSIRDGISDTTSIGGAALYVALSATRAGLASRPLSVVGTDLNVIQHDPLLSILDLSGVRTVAGRSAGFTLTYDAEGTLVSADSDYGASTQLTTHALEQIRARQDGPYHVCCRRPLDIAKVLNVLVHAATPFSLDFFLPSAAESITAAASALPMAHVVFVNAAEYDLLTNAVPTRHLREVLVTDGPRPAQLICSGRCVAQILPPQVATVDVTGSGDTLAGTFLAARAAGLDGAVALEWAVCAASRHAASPAIQLNR